MLNNQQPVLRLMNYDYQHGKHAIYFVNYHLVLTPKKRKPVLVGEVKQRLERIFAEVDGRF